MDISLTSVIWVLICAALVYFMQAGFALCEAGLTRAKNTGNATDNHHIVGAT